MPPWCFTESERVCAFRSFSLMRKHSYGTFLILSSAVSCEINPWYHACPCSSAGSTCTLSNVSAGSCGWEEVAAGKLGDPTDTSVQSNECYTQTMKVRSPSNACVQRGQTSLLQIPYNGKLSREKTFTGFVAIHGSFLHEIWVRGIFQWHPVSNL